MFGLAKALVPFLIPLGWGIGYAVTTSMQKLTDQYFSGKDSKENANQRGEEDLLWKGPTSTSTEQTDPEGEVCREAGVSGTSASIPSRTVRTEDDTTASEQTCPAGEVCSEQTNGVVDSAPDSPEGVPTVDEQTDPAGEVCSETAEHEGEGAVAEKSPPAGEDLSATDLAAKAVAEATEKALVSLVPSLALPLNSPLRSCYTRTFPLRCSLAEEDILPQNTLSAIISVGLEIDCPPDTKKEEEVGSDFPGTQKTALVGHGLAEDGLRYSWVDAALQSVLNLGVTRRCLAQERDPLEASPIPSWTRLILSAVHDPGKHFCPEDLSPVLMELRERCQPSDLGRDLDIKCLLESSMVWLDAFGSATDRELYNNNSCSVCGTVFLELLNNGSLLSLPPVRFPASIATLLYYWLDVRGKRRCSVCESALERKHCLTNNKVLVFFLHRLTRKHRIVSSQVVDVPAKCKGGTERYHLSSVVCGGSEPTHFYTYVVKGGQITKATNQNVCSVDFTDCTEDISTNGFIFIYEKL